MDFIKTYALNARRMTAAFFFFTAMAAPPLFAEEPAAEKKADTLDVTITGESKDDVPLVKTPPPLGLPFEDVVGLAREGQRERVLARPIDHMSAEDQIKLTELDARQALSPWPVKIPAPPFFRMEVPEGRAGAPWEFRVVDQNDQTIKTVSGPAAPEGLVEWDGFNDGAMKLEAGSAYTPLLFTTDAKGNLVRHFGEALQLDVLQYELNNDLHVEFHNRRLYKKGTPEFSPDMEPLLEACLDGLRLRAGKEFRVSIQSKNVPASLLEKRLGLWKKFLKDRLVLPDDQITVLSGPAGAQGDVTSIIMKARP